jgi:hypothetical protein
MQFVSEINRVIDLASNHPERFPTKHLEIRCAQVRAFHTQYFSALKLRVLSYWRCFTQDEIQRSGKHAHNNTFHRDAQNAARAIIIAMY